MKIFFKKVAALLMTAAIICALSVPVFASYMEHEGLEVSVEMDKESYEEGELITATITVKNTNAEAVIITNLEQLIPEGYELAKDSEAATENVELAPGETVTLNVTYGGEAAEPSAEDAVEDFFNTVIYGETAGIPNLLIAIIIIAAVIIFFKLT